MKILAIIVGVILGVILFLGIVALIIYGKIRLTMKKIGFQANSFKDMANEVKRAREEDSTRARSVSGMTSLLLPNIREDFPDFNEQELYNKAETALRLVFSSIEDKNVSELKNYPFLQTNVRKIIEDYETANISERFDDIHFHKFAIYQYEKKDGMATVTVSISLEYNYQKKKDDKILSDFTKYKKQTRYQCKFIYVYDIAKVGASAKVLAINCPNCGAAITALGHKHCDYCGSAVKEVNLRSWECSSYVEF